MKINIKNGPFIKSNINKKKIELSIFLSLLVINIYKIYIDGIFPIFYLVSIFVPLFIINVIYDDIKKRKISLVNYISVVITSLITNILVPVNSSYLFILLLTFVTGIIGKIFKVNEISLNLSLILIFNTQTVTNYNIYILSILLLLSIIFLIHNRALKFRICISYILMLILFFTLNILDINKLIMLLLIGVFVVPYFKSSPNTSTVQYIYGILLGIISSLNSFHITYIFITLFSIIFTYIDFYNSKILSLK